MGFNSAFKGLGYSEVLENQNILNSESLFGG